MIQDIRAKNEMKVSVIIPVFNGKKTIEQNLNAVKQQCAFVYDFEIIVVDDGSQDSTPSLLKAIDGITVVTQANRGPAAARNAGAHQASGEILVFTDADTIPHSDWLHKLVAPFSNPSIMTTAGTYTIANPDFALANLVQSEIDFRHRAYGEFIRFAGTYNLAIRKALFENIGGFNEAYTQASGEDNDLCYKILRAGYQIKFVSDAKVAHHHPEKIFKYFKEQFRHGYWRALLYTKFPERVTGGDSYTLFKDGMEVVLCLITIFSTLFSRTVSRINLSKLSMISLSAIIIWQITFAQKLCNNFATTSYTAYVLTLRAFARTLGLISGIVSHTIFRGLINYRIIEGNNH